MRPGFLADCTDTTGVGSFSHTSSFHRTGLGAFGKSKGVVSPPPTAVPTEPAIYRGGRWVCPGKKPRIGKKGKRGGRRGQEKAEKRAANNYYHCCPSGWKLVPFGTKYPCKDEADLAECGPRPEGATDVICCPSLARWANLGPAGENPCPGARQVKAITLTPGEILADPLDIGIAREPLVTPGLMIAMGSAVLLGIGMVIFTRKRAPG